jgi:translation initiation factor IF-3
VRLIDEKNDQVGVVPTDEAMRRAEEAGLDLVEVAPQDRPPVCRIMDYGKWKYQQKRKTRTKHAHESQIKEVRLRPKTDEHDKNVKVKNARTFLEKGDKVQFTMLFRGRERAHPKIGLDMFNSIMTELDGVAKIEREPKFEGRRLTMVVVPAK